jgi:hypothetical protein
MAIIGAGLVAQLAVAVQALVLPSQLMFVAKLYRRHDNSVHPDYRT